MKMAFHLSCLTATVALLSFVVGCDSKPAGSGNGGTTASADHDDHDDEHGHEEHEGPHGGHVIELGRNHEYHAELVDDDEHESVTVYILDKDVKELPIDAATITMNLTVEGTPKTFELAAAGATGGMTSRFDAGDKSLFEALHVHEATGKISVTINGTPYSGAVEHHEHDEDGDHADHDDHK